MIWRTLFVLLLAFCLIIPLKSQDSDSNNPWLLYQKGQKEKDDSIKIKLFEQVIQLHKNQSSDSFPLRVYYFLGAAYYKSGKYKASIKQYKIYTSYCNQKGKLECAYLYKDIAMSYRKLNDYELAIEYLLQVDSDLDKNNKDNQNLLGRCYNQLGNIYRNLKEYTTSSLYHKKGLEIWNTLNYPFGIALSSNNIGLVELQLNNYPIAIDYFHHALTIWKELQNISQLARTQNNLGAAYFFQNQYDSSLFYYEKALAIRDTLGNTRELAITLYELADAYLVTSQFTKTQRLLSRLDELMPTIQEPTIWKDYYNLSAKYALSQGQTQKSKTLFAQQKALGDSIYNADMTKSVADAQEKYYTKEKEQEALLERERADANRKLNYYMGGAITLLFIVLGALIFAYKKINQQRAEIQGKHDLLEEKNNEINHRNEEIETQNVEINEKNIYIETLMRELHHRVKNNFDTLSGLISFQQQSISDPMILEAIKEIDHRLQSVATIHVSLYQGNKIDRVAMKECLVNLSDNLAFSYKIKNLKLQHQIEEIELTADQAITVGLLANEVITNALKYAFESISNPELSIKMYRQNSKYYLEIRDNGVGMPEDSTQKKDSYGVKLIKGLSRQLRGDSQYKADPITGGTVFQLDFTATELPAVSILENKNNS